MTNTLNGPRFPAPVPQNWQRGIAEFRPQARTELVHSAFINWPRRSQLVKAPYLREFAETMTAPSDIEVIQMLEDPDNLTEDVALHRTGMVEGRGLFTRGLRAFIYSIFDQYAPEPNLAVLEAGCGPELLLFELAPDRLKDGWQAFDINPKLVSHAQEKARLLNFPVDVQLRNVYRPFHKIKPVTQPNLWVGLSSYDSFDLHLAFKAMGVPKGTKFIHVQDLYPAVDPIIYFDRKSHCQPAQWLVPRSAIEAFNLDHVRTLIRAGQIQEASEAAFSFLMQRERQLFFERGKRLLSPTDDLHYRMIHCLKGDNWHIQAEGLGQATYVGEVTPDQQQMIAEKVMADFTKPSAYFNLSGDYVAGRYDYSRTTAEQLELTNPFTEVVVANYIVAEKM